jgi:phosphate:Na+ symporter
MSAALKIGLLIGGLGLFLLSARMITTGMKEAAGDALRDVLGRWTSTPFRGIVAGAAITGVVQSSGVVALAAIGFVNAGLLSLFNALGVIYGANVGTTATSWLVVFAGFDFNLGLFAYPLLGLGMVVRILRRADRLGAAGEAVAGFGLFFIAVDTFRTTFADLAAAIDVGGTAADGPAGLLLFVVAGVVFTVLIQSSSAVIALVLAATASGVVPLAGAAAIIIGSNIGSTSTALFAAVGSTPNAKRVAAVHVLFNAVTAAVALALLPLLIWSMGRVGLAGGSGPHVPAILAAYHTLFNVLGVALFWPFTRRLAGMLERHFRTTEEDEGRPRYLDSTFVETPVVAVGTMIRELGHVGMIARGAASVALVGNRQALANLKVRRSVVRNLGIAIADFIGLLRRQHLAQGVADALPVVLRVTQYYEETAVLAERTFAIRWSLMDRPRALLAPTVDAVYLGAKRIIDLADPMADGFTPQALTAETGEFLKLYQSVKGNLLRAGADQRLSIEAISVLLDQISRVRRMTEQAAKAARHLHALAHPEDGELANPPAPLDKNPGPVPADG